MFKAFKFNIIAFLLLLALVSPGQAFKLFGYDSQAQPGTSSPLDHGAQAGGLIGGPVGGKGFEGPVLELDDKGVIGAPADEGMNIWIPGIGVVGKMPQFDFGLEMLYGNSDAARNEVPDVRELEEFDSDFAIKGTIKRKF